MFRLNAGLSIKALVMKKPVNLHYSTHPQLWGTSFHIFTGEVIEAFCKLTP